MIVFIINGIVKILCLPYLNFVSDVREMTEFILALILYMIQVQ
jgi:hypothetical protein